MRLVKLAYLISVLGLMGEGCQLRNRYALMGLACIPIKHRESYERCTDRAADAYQREEDRLAFEDSQQAMRDQLQRNHDQDVARQEAQDARERTERAEQAESGRKIAEYQSKMEREQEDTNRCIRINQKIVNLLGVPSNDFQSDVINCVAYTHTSIDNRIAVVCMDDATTRDEVIKCYTH